MMKQQQRYYAAVTASKSDIESRVLAVCKAFDKITADKVTSFPHTGWTGKYVPPGSPQVAPMGATYGGYLKSCQIVV